MRILFFAQLRDVTGCEMTELPAASGRTADELWAGLLEKFPALAAHRTHTRLAHNWEYAAPATVFTDGDEVALIPPVSGG